MLDAAFRQIAGVVSTQFGGPYAPGKLLYPGTPIRDDGGDIITPGTPFEVDCQVQVDVCTEQMRQAEGFMERDVRLIILVDRELDTTPDVRVDAGKFAGNVYSIQSADRDTLGFGWQCRARAV